MTKQEFWQKIDSLIKEFNSSQTRLVVQKNKCEGYRTLSLVPAPVKEAVSVNNSAWVEQMLYRFFEDEEARVLGNCPSGITVVMVDQKLGKSVCQLTDDYDSDIGIAVAYAKAIGEPVPKSL